MRRRECSREHDVAEAARRGVLDPAVREHARGCAVCAETLAVAHALGELSHADAVGRATADPRVLWLKAQLAPRRATAGASESPAGGSAVVWIAVAACWAVFLAWRWSELRGLLDRLSLGELMVSGGGLGAVPITSLVVVAAMAAVTLAIMLHQVFVEEL
ncbi:MAG: hypothetical protein NDJ92_17590 [Thermoanaerobaculia bacterium]|nr:hypothetical protein [Thermoanaerobaculia bacterium]